MPGATARQAEDFGDPSRWGTLGAEPPGHSVRVTRNAEVVLFSP